MSFWGSGSESATVITIDNVVDVYLRWIYSQLEKHSAIFDCGGDSCRSISCLRGAGAACHKRRNERHAAQPASYWRFAARWLWQPFERVTSFENQQHQWEKHSRSDCSLHHNLKIAGCRMILQWNFFRTLAMSSIVRSVGRHFLKGKARRGIDPIDSGSGSEARPSPDSDKVSLDSSLSDQPDDGGLEEYRQSVSGLITQLTDFGRLVGQLRSHFVDASSPPALSPGLRHTSSDLFPSPSASSGFGESLARKKGGVLHVRGHQNYWQRKADALSRESVISRLGSRAALEVHGRGNPIRVNQHENNESEVWQRVHCRVSELTVGFHIPSGSVSWLSGEEK